jgi:DNA polymerase-3 subunit alpha
VQEDLFRLKKELGLPGLATNDLHYTYADDAKPHEVLLCVQTGKTLADPNRFKFDAQDFYLKSPAEMRAQWDPQFPEACDNTLLIAERVDVGFTEGQDLMPRAPVPEGETEESWLVKEVERGLHQRFPNGVTDQYRKQAEYELGVIIQMGFPGYFLVVADLIQHAKSVGIRCGPGRGSAAGSLVAYVLGITDLDPIKHKLIFERFLNPERISMPDIDMDFDERRRGEMIRYTTEKYGEDRIAQIITYSTIKAKAAIKDSARVLFGQPGYAVADRITKAMPPAIMGKDIPLSGIFDPAHKRYSEATEVRALYEVDPQVKEIIDTARGPRGPQAPVGRARRRRDHVEHAADRRHPDPAPRGRRRDHHAVRHGRLRDARAAEDGLPRPAQPHDHRRRAGEHRAQRQAEARHRRRRAGRPEDLRAARPAARRSGCSSSTAGPMRDLLRRMAPTEFDDISAVGALYRPGPMGANAHNDYADRKNKRQEVTPDPPGAGRAAQGHPRRDLRPDRLPGTGHGDRPEARRLHARQGGPAAPGDGQEEEGDPGQGVRRLRPGHEGPRLLRGRGQDALGHPAAVLGLRVQPRALRRVRGRLLLDGVPQGELPAEYMAAVLTVVRDDKDKAAVYLAECRRMGIRVLPPDVNDSVRNFAPVGDDIRFGLGGIRNVGANVVDAIVAARKEKGGFTDFSTSCARSTRWSATRRSSSR